MWLGEMDPHVLAHPGYQNMFLKIARYSTKSEGYQTESHETLVTINEALDRPMRYF